MGNDAYEGTAQRHFRTIARAAAVVSEDAKIESAENEGRIFYTDGGGTVLADGGIEAYDNHVFSVNGGAWEKDCEPLTKKEFRQSDFTLPKLLWEFAENSVGYFIALMEFRTVITMAPTSANIASAMEDMLRNPRSMTTALMPSESIIF